MDMNSNLTSDYLDAAKRAAAVRTAGLARRIALTPSEREDVHQELLLDLIARADAFDPSRGCANTYTGMVSEHRATELLDVMVKERIRMQSFPTDTEAANDADMCSGVEQLALEFGSLWGQDDDLFACTDTVHDLEQALACMSQEQMSLWQLLEACQDLAEACAKSGVPKTSFYRRVEELQMHLRMFGLKVAA